jgi:hypothetical protein
MLRSSSESNRRRWATDGRPFILASLLLLLAWSIAVPVFESPNEVHHWQYTPYLRSACELPLYGPDFVEANSSRSATRSWRQSQPRAHIRRRWSGSR